MRVLVVEDEERLRRLISEALTQEGYAVDAAEDGIEAAYLAEEVDYDAIVLDWMLPKKSGIEICREMRDRSDWTPVIMLTARDAVTDRIEGLDSGADDYLVKPFAFSELAARLRALVRRGKDPRPPVLSAGSIELDAATRKVVVDGADIELTPKEFSLLEYLLKRKGEVITRPSLIEHVWDFAYDGASNVIDVYIGYLRKKLGAEADRIETVRGVGYRMLP